MEQLCPDLLGAALCANSKLLISQSFHGIPSVSAHFQLGFLGYSGKKSLAIQETCIQPLGQKEPLEKGMATHSSILTWRIPMNRGAWQATVHGVSMSQTQLSN